MNLRHGIPNLVLAFVFLWASWPAPEIARAATADLSVYADSLASGWQDWSWNIADNFNNTNPVHSGSKSLKVTFSSGWDGLKLQDTTPLNLAGYTALRFWINGGGGGQTMQVTLSGSGELCMNAQLTLTATNSWKQVEIPLAEMGLPAQVTSIQFFNNTAGAQAAFYLDDIAFVSGTPPPAAPTATGPDLTVDAGAARKPISPLIYGMSFANENLATELSLPINRWGGNATTRYNWKNDTANHASDWYFENIPNNDPKGSASDLFVDQNLRTGTQTLLTVPLIGWTPRNGGYACGFSVAKYGAQDSVDPWRPDCGNGVQGKINITNNDPLDTSMKIDPSFVAAWIARLKGKYGAAGQGGVTYYNLDNEPMLWNSTHRDVHPLGTSYDELRDKTYAYAAAIKDADPGALTLGPVLWGWSAYFYSGLDVATGGTFWWDTRLDRRAHGDMPFLPWYLQQMKAYQDARGTRILDYVDVHMYPQGYDFASNATDTATSALRLRSTRALWDPTYKDESWINDYVDLIPRLHQWVSQYYPGTKTAISEYNFGSQCSVNGALAQADTLGIFGREGLDLAALWGPPSSAQPGAYAFRLFRNYDGAGHRFGDTSISALSNDSNQLSVFGAQRGSDGALTLMFINKTGSDLKSKVNVNAFNGMGYASVYRYSAAKLDGIQSLGGQTLSAGGTTVTFAANSITLWVLPAYINLPDKLYLPALLH